MKDDQLILERQLSFILYVCSKETIRRYQTYLEDLNLTYTQYLVMLVLWNGDNIPVNELGKRLYLDSGTLTPMIKKLETKNLLKRVRSEEHTSELQSRFDLVCRLLLDKKKPT